MKRIMSIIMAVVLVFPLLLQAQVQAATAIGIYINGIKLSVDQNPIVISNRALLPLRAIFEALDAKVEWNQQTKVVTATKDDRTIVLKLGAKTATINNATVDLDVPVQSIRGRTLVPVRFVSEALGEEVDWNSSTQRVTITTSTQVNPVSYVSARVIGQAGDGSDLEVTFPKVAKESGVSQYRVFVVKSGQSSAFNLANAASNNNYTSVPVQGKDITILLTSQTKDVSGEAVKANQSYVVYVLTVGKGSNPSILSSASQTMTIQTGSPVTAVTNVTASDVSDYGDGRDLKTTFTKPQSDSSIANYRVMVVKTADVSKFNITAANGVSSGNYTTVSKSGTILTTTLIASSKDTSGALIKSGTAYTVFVVSISSNANSNSNKLSSGSSSIVLNNNPTGSPVITKVEDVSDYGDGRDLLFSFNKVADESKIGSYRIFVVKANSVNNFNLSVANAVSSSNYTYVSKTGYNIGQVLASNARDVDGTTIQNGVSYRIFVMSVGTGSYLGSNLLSAYSSAISLSNNNNVIGVTSLGVNDVSDYNDGRDLRVTFNRVSDESNVSHYRIMVVKSGNTGNFNLSLANAVSSSNYTYVSKTGTNISQILASGARDVDGTTIQNGISYRVFVMSVGTGSYSGNNALSSYSSTITLASNTSITAVTNLGVSDMSNYNDGRDLSVTFNRVSDESYISHYRIMVVKSGNAGSFNLSLANDVSSSNYTYVSKTGTNISQVLATGARDVDGATIQNGVSYRVFVMSVGTGGYSGSNALSSNSNDIVLINTSAVAAATNVNAVKDSVTSSWTVSFDMPNQIGISKYEVMIVPYAQPFDLVDANYYSSSVTGSVYQTITATGLPNVSININMDSWDVNKAILQPSSAGYYVYILSKANGASVNALSSKSNVITFP
jgi:hypothetical protein